MVPLEATAELRTAIRTMRDEELEHLHIAKEQQTRTSSMSATILSKLVGTGCRAAIALVSRV